MKNLLCLLMLSMSLNLAWGQTQPASLTAEDILVSGPMVGYAEMREVMLWVQTNGPANVYVTYSTGQDAPVYRTETYATRGEQAYTARLVANQVQPGTVYTYKLFINGQEIERPYALTFQTPPLWQYRTDPPEMKIAFGSCVFINDEPYDRPGKPYGGDYRIFESIHKMRPDLMLWLGDNTYLREADWFSTTGIIHRFTHSRQVEEMQPLLASTSNYAIWDDHDYGPNNSDFTFRAKDVTRKAFQLFWGNPTYGVDRQGGITSYFEWGDAAFFMLDNRSFRDPNDKTTETRSILGEKQLDWLLNALISSNATWKFVMVGGQMINSFPGFENHAAIAPEERQKILDHIVAEEIRNVIFLTGDRHHSEISKYEKEGIAIYDFTSSPLTSGAANFPDEANELREGESYIGERNFGMLELSGARKSRVAKLTFYDVDGKSLHTYEVKAAYKE